QVLSRVRPGAPGPVQAFLDHGEDFLQAGDVPTLVAKMNALTGEDLVDAAALERTIRARDAELANTFSKDTQITALRGARKYLGRSEEHTSELQSRFYLVCR